MSCLLLVNNDTFQLKFSVNVMRHSSRTQYYVILLSLFIIFNPNVDSRLDSKVVENFSNRC